MRVRAVRLALVATLMVATATACTTEVPGHGTVGALSPTKRLVLALEPAPAGSRPGSTAWDHNTTPTVDQFTDEVYPSAAAADIADRLRSQGIAAIAHRVWFTPAGDQGDVVLLGFASSTGAESRYIEVTRAKESDPDISTFPVPGADEALGTYEPKIDKFGNVRSITYAREGNVVVEFFSFSARRLHESELLSWLTTQLHRL